MSNLRRNAPTSSSFLHGEHEHEKVDEPTEQEQNRIDKSRWRNGQTELSPQNFRYGPTPYKGPAPAHHRRDAEMKANPNRIRMHRAGDGDPQPYEAQSAKPQPSPCFSKGAGNHDGRGKIDSHDDENLSGSDTSEEVKPGHVRNKVNRFNTNSFLRKDFEKPKIKKKTPRVSSEEEIVQYPFRQKRSDASGESSRDDNPQLKSETHKKERPPVVRKHLQNATGESDAFADIMSQLNLEKYRQTKLTLQDFLNIGKKTICSIEIRTDTDIPWHFLQKVMALNLTARNTTLQCVESKGEEEDYSDEIDTDASVHPLDVLCVLLHCSDHFLQQEIVSKMSKCQFAVPLLLPAGDGRSCTLMLWTLRDIVKCWRPLSFASNKGFMEHSLVKICMPTFSFVRLGDTDFSKSKILNEVLWPAHSPNNTFVNREMDGGTCHRRVSDGLVEISWFFPAGSGTFPDPFAVTNLHGDLAFKLGEFKFLTRISAVVFIFTESLTVKDCNFFSQFEGATFCFVLNPNNKQKQEILQTLSTKLRVFTITKNAKQSVNEIRKKISKSMMDKTINRLSLEDMAIVAGEHGIKVDENSVECQKAKERASRITSEIRDVSQYKKETMTLQGEPWKQITELEKEMCRMKNQGTSNSTVYKDNLTKKRSELIRSQYKQPMPDAMKLFVKALTEQTQVEKRYFMKWLKFNLDSLVLTTDYKRRLSVSPDATETKELSHNVHGNSLGIEHFLREMGQFYEAEGFMIRQREISSKQRQFSELPGIAAGLLLDGFPLELIDGDASNIPLEWITEVLNDLTIKLGGQSRMRVLTVLGVQSSGKSTLLNTMFGLQFPVADGRCTRGVFMTLMRVEGDFIEELGCDFILVIDTEGLKAPELGSLENSYEHDNELATLVVGLSDITIINIAMENVSEMKDILQIVVHAFLRMSEVGKKPNCYLVHQNVSNVTAHDKNEDGRTKLMQELDDMTKLAAKMEKRNESIKFSDIIDFDSENQTWYIPGLWHGAPPMAPINLGYSNYVFELKKELIHFVKRRNSPEPQNTRSFVTWIKSLWNAVKHETFIFSFRNVLVAEAYNQLSIRYSELEWNFRRKVHSYLAKSENVIKNNVSGDVSKTASDILNNNIKALLDKEEEHMTHQLSQFFEKGCLHVYLVERYREEFLIHVKSLRKDLEVMASSKCWEAVRIQTGKNELQDSQTKFQQTIEHKIEKYLEDQRGSQSLLSEDELKREFDALWHSILAEMKVNRLMKRRIDEEMLKQLKKEQMNKSGAVTEILHNVKSLKDYGRGSFEMMNNYQDFSILSLKGIKELFTNQYRKKLEQIALSLRYNCLSFVQQKVATREDYNELYCQELLTTINTKLEETEVKKLNPTQLFEVNLKLDVLGRAAPFFQKMHDDFGVNNDPRLRVNKLKHQYFEIFTNKLKRQDNLRKRTNDFYEQCLKPAIVEHVHRNLGRAILDEIFKSSDAAMFGSQKYFQFTLLKELLQINQFTYYIDYITQYEGYVKRWISEYIAKRYQSVDNALSQILSSIRGKIQAVLRHPKVRNCRSMSEFLQIFSAHLSKHLVLLRDVMKVSAFQNTSDVQQFSSEIECSINTMDRDITSVIQSSGFEAMLLNLTQKPQDELFERVMGCRKKCPFCDAPCEAAGTQHLKHSVTVHRPKGLAQCTWSESDVLCYSLCSTDILSNGTFINSDTEGQWHPYKEYQRIYPDWHIQPDADLNSSDYWKFVFKTFSKEFAEHFQAKPAEIPWEWEKITQETALCSLQEVYNTAQ